MTTAEALLAAAVTLMLLATTLAIGFHRQALADDFLDQSEAIRAAVEYRAQNSRCGLPETKMTVESVITTIASSSTNYSIDDPDKWFVQFGGAEGENDVITVWQEVGGEKKFLSVTRRPLEDVRLADRDFMDAMLARDCP